MPLRIFVAVLAFALLAMSVTGAFLVWQRGFVEERQTLEEIAAMEGSNPPPDPGLNVFEKAMNLVRDGDHIAARDTLFDLVRVYRDSSCYDDAKRIIGEINMDLVLSSRPAPGKREYIVQRGDSLGLIARRNQCSTNYLVRANGLLSTTIHPGEKLMVFPLDFSVVIHLGEGTVTLMRKGRFFKEYPLQRYQLPPATRVPVETTVKSKSAWIDGRSVRSTDPRYALADKWIQFAKAGLLILPGEPEPETGEEAPEDAAAAAVPDAVAGVDELPSPGIFLLAADADELFTVLAIGSPVTVVR